MMIVEIEVPIMGKKYDFQIDENVPLNEVKDEVAEMICRKEQCPLKGNLRRLLIWTHDGRELSRERSAQENGIRTGSRMILA